MCPVSIMQRPVPASFRALERWVVVRVSAMGGKRTLLSCGLSAADALLTALGTQIAFSARGPCFACRAELRASAQSVNARYEAGPTADVFETSRCRLLPLDGP